MFSSAGIILVGGRSRRMGRDKAHLPLPGNEQITFVEHLSSLLTTQCSEVVLVARDAVQSAEYSLPGVHTVTDKVPHVGPLMGLYSGLSAIKASHALVTAVDMPFVQPDVIAFLLAQPLEDALLVPVVNGVPQVLLAVYPRSVLPTIEELLRAGRPGPRFLLDVARVRYIEETQLRKVDPELRSFINVNTPEEWQQYVRRRQ
jgi:molybdopterin-guanine dinucleotide biosynthesis protein A